MVLAARGYPQTPTTGGIIEGADEDYGAQTKVFHAGTRLDAEGRLTASGGRVLNVCARAGDVATARTRAYAAVDQIRWADGFCRRDIAWRALER